MLSKYFYAKTNLKHFQEYMNNLIDELKEKRILIYGAGQAFINLNEKYHFDKLNIVAISDLKFKKISNFKGLLSIPPIDINKYEYDIILVTLESSQYVVKDLVNKQNINENNIRVIFKEEIPMERENYNYLETFKFNKHLNKLTKKLKNKSIVLYGAGSFLEVINKYFDLSELNIIGVSDKRFERYGNNEGTFLGYKTIKPHEIRDLKPDYVLVATKFFIKIIEDLMSNTLSDTNIKIRPLVKKSFFTLLREII